MMSVFQQEAGMVRIEDLRRRRAWSQAELAVAAGVSPKTIWMLENGKREKVQGRIIRSVAKALGVQPEDVDEFRSSLGPLAAEGR
jgi:transcriptional regulator with XRE-family HTH domain